MADTLFHLLRAVAAERERQDTKFGPQDYPLINPVHRSVYASTAESWKRTNDGRISAGTRTGDGVLLEEVYEAISAATPGQTVEELVQVAAVALLLAEMEIRRDPDALPPPCGRTDSGKVTFDTPVTDLTPENSPLLFRVLSQEGFALLTGRISRGENSPVHRPANCTCVPPGGMSPGEIDGPDEDCPDHGNPALVCCAGYTDTEDRTLDAVQIDGFCSLCGLPADPEGWSDDNA